MFLPRTSWRGVPRRNVLQFAGLALSAPAWSFAAAPATGASAENTIPEKFSLPDAFPTQPPDLVREMVRVSHFDLNRVHQLVEAQPSLARAAWDWGFGDWESALGAASHMGNRPIAEYLISKGARPSLFSSAMLGQLDVIKAFVAAQPGVERIRGPHSISLLAHAQAGGELHGRSLNFSIPSAMPAPTLLVLWFRRISTPSSANILSARARTIAFRSALRRTT